MRKAFIILLLLLFGAQSFAQSSHTVTVAGCVLNANGTFRLLTRTKTYILKGHRNEMFGFNGKMVEITGTTEEVSKAEGVPLVLHVTKIKKIADFCQ